MKKEVEINKMDIKVFYAKDKHYKNIDFILENMERANLILGWTRNNDTYEISYLYHDDKDFILECIEKVNRVEFQGCKPIEKEKSEVGLRMTSYKEKATLIF